MVSFRKELLSKFVGSKPAVKSVPYKVETPAPVAEAKPTKAPKAKAEKKPAVKAKTARKPRAPKA